MRPRAVERCAQDRVVSKESRVHGSDLQFRQREMVLPGIPPT